MAICRLFPNIFLIMWAHLAILVLPSCKLRGREHLSMRSLVVQPGVLRGLWYISACRVSWCSWGYWVVFGISQHTDSHSARWVLRGHQVVVVGFKRGIVFLGRTGQQSDVMKSLGGLAELNLWLNDSCTKPVTWLLVTAMFYAFWIALLLLCKALVFLNLILFN